MSERKFDDETKFSTPDGTVEIVGVARDNERIVYSVKYHDVAGTPTSTLAQEELENNSDISQI